MISHRYKCMFFQVPKCASTTICDWLSMHGKAHRIVKPWWYGGLLCERGQAVTQVMNLYPDYFTFTFVRNPYERFVSLFLDATRRYAARGFPGDLGSLRDFTELCRDVLGDTGHLWGREARDFFRENGEREYGPGRVKLRYLAWVTYHARAQVDFLPDCNPQRLFGVRRDNDAPLSFIGTVEEVDADFRRVRAILGLPAFELPNRNTSGLGTGSERRRRYRGYYDDATRRLVEDLYAADLEFTGCGFEEGRTTVAVAARNARAPRTPAPAGVKEGRKVFLSRLWFNLSSSEICVRAWYIRHLVIQHLLRPLGRLCRLPL